MSYWLESEHPPAPRPTLDGARIADVAIMGAGFSGLWTAHALLARDPSLDVVVCEAEHVGFGASGRNGGWCNASIGVTPGELARRSSVEAARRTQQELRATVDEIGRVCAAEGIDAGYRKGGVLRIARGAHELAAAREGLRMLERLGLADDARWLDSSELAERVRVAGARGAVFDPHCAVVHPGRVVRGLAAAVERAGAQIFERSPVTRVLPREPGAPNARLLTDHGEVRAETVVLAGEAYLSQLPGWRRAVLPVYSLIVLTEPLSDEQWAAVGWDGQECLSSHRLTVDYLSRTDDGRILFGGRGAPYHLGSRIRRRYDHHGATHEMLRRELVGWFPMLDGVGFSHAWGGPLGMPRDWMPNVWHDREQGLAAAYGYTGQGVAATNLAGRILADALTGIDSELLSLPLAGHRSRRWEPEPLRWLATRYLQAALARIDDRARRTGDPPSGRSLAERLIRH
ncbi:MAG: NAD(P)/FAD-dependent oxidoreductase [Egibacteraceae bacterium]